MRLLVMLSFLIFFFFFPSSLFGQTLVYKGYKGDDYIGDMIVTRKVEGNKVSYRSDAKLTVNFILTWEMRFYYEADFVEGKLERSLVELSRDGKLRTQVIGQRKGNAFHALVDGDSVISQGLIDYCVLRTYFEAPKGQNRIFSERWGDYLKVSATGANSYLLQPPNGSQNTLIYQDNICKEMQFNHTLANVRFVLKE